MTRSPGTAVLLGRRGIASLRRRRGSRRPAAGVLAAAGVLLGLAEDQLAHRVLEVEGRLGVLDPAARLDEIVVVARLEIDELVAEQPAHLDAGDRLLAELQRRIDAESHDRDELLGIEG